MRARRQTVLDENFSAGGRQFFDMLDHRKKTISVFSSEIKIEQSKCYAVFYLTLTQLINCPFPQLLNLDFTDLIAARLPRPLYIPGYLSHTVYIGQHCVIIQIVERSFKCPAKKNNVGMRYDELWLYLAVKCQKYTTL